MGKKSSPRSGSLQFWPRKRAKKFLPSVNWKPVSLSFSSDKSFPLGFICYKVGMKSAYVKDNTPDSMTKNKRIIIPVTILECPSMKILSVRLYKNSNVVNEIFSADNKEKELKRKIKLQKEHDKKKILEILEKKLEEKNFDDIRIIAYSLVKNTGIKKSPDIIELALSGSLEEKIKFVKENLDKEISVFDVFKTRQLVDVRGLTKGHGFSGPVKRFGIGLKQHKSEKGRRRPGSLGPWHPARVTFRTPMAGQLGMFTRVVNNLKVIKIGKSQEENIDPASGFKHYGNVKTNYIILYGSVQGTEKRQLLLTFPFRKTKKQDKKNYELIELR